MCFNHGYRQWEIVDILKNNLVWRNTKESVKGEYEVPSLVEDLVLLELNPAERLLYEYAAAGMLPKGELIIAKTSSELIFILF